MSEEGLEHYLKRHIAVHGPVDIGQFMSIALSHPEHGYYMKQDPLGARGDFTTAPEISQMFGELIGAWVADVWIQMGRPAPFGLVECGPGRGTLMADMLRAVKNVEGFHSACIIHLIEISPALKAVQAQTLAAYDPHWQQSLSAISGEYPLIIIGNEFLDALPLRQLVKTQEGWAERVVCIGEGEALQFGLRPAGMELTAFIPENLRAANTGEIFEIAPSRIESIRGVEQAIKRARQGAALFIDYGHAQAGLGDTFQAMHKHQYVPVLSHIGDADLTSHVDFSAFGYKVTTQGEFLRALGIEARANYLRGKADGTQKEQIESALHRLTASDQMGKLFKVMGMSHGDHIALAGF